MGGVIITLENLFDNYKKFEKIAKKKNDENKIDLRDLEKNPTSLLPLLCICKNENLKFDGINAYEWLIDTLLGNDLFSKLPDSREESDKSDFITKYVENLDVEYGSYFVLRHIISELANNVYDHAKCENKPLNSYILSECHSNNNKLDLCVVDDGLSIPGLFEKSGVTFIDDCQALEKAIGTFSTVSDTFYERGNGLRTISRLVSEGNGGEILIVSRNGVLHINNEDYGYYLLDDEHTFNGTLASIRLNKYEVQNIYELLGPQKLNRYPYVLK